MSNARGGEAHVKEAMGRLGNALSWRGQATPSRLWSAPTQAGESDPDPCASGDARLLWKKPASGGESPWQPSESRGAELCRIQATGGEPSCHPLATANRRDGLLAHECSSETEKAIDWVDCRRYSFADYEVSFWFAMISRHDHHHHHRHEHDHHHDHDHHRHLSYHHISVSRSSPSPLLMHSHRTAITQPFMGHVACLRILPCCHLADKQLCHQPCMGTSELARAPLARSLWRV